MRKEDEEEGMAKVVVFKEQPLFLMVPCAWDLELGTEGEGTEGGWMLRWLVKMED